MHAEEFAKIVTELYGYGWSSSLAKLLGMNDRTLRDMANGKRRIPDNLAEILRLLYAWHGGSND
jgi:plasmid maintenance system antidote protein VapI